MIIYKIRTRDDSPIIRKQIPVVSQNSGQHIPNEHYELKNNYRDPFLSTSKNKVNGSTFDSVRKSAAKTPEKWPDFRFNGSVVSGKTVRGHITVNGEDKILRVNESVLDDYTINVITPDSVLIRHKGISKWIRNNN